MNKPKKLIRHQIIKHVKPGEFETITNQDELNELYHLKVQEELLEIKASNYKDINEFVDLMDAAEAFAHANGFSAEQLHDAMMAKTIKNGIFFNIAINNLNPENPSNAIYFDKQLQISIPEKAPSIAPLEPSASFSETPPNSDLIRDGKEYKPLTGEVLMQAFNRLKQFTAKSEDPKGRYFITYIGEIEIENFRYKLFIRADYF